MDDPKIVLVIASSTSLPRSGLLHWSLARSAAPLRCGSSSRMFFGLRPHWLLAELQASALVLS